MLQPAQLQRLNNHEKNKQLLHYFKTAKDLFNGLEQYYENKNRDIFLKQHEKLGKIDETLFEDFQYSEFSSFILRAKALAEVWNGLKIVIDCLQNGKPAEAQELQVWLHQKMEVADGIETVSEHWKEHVDWLQEALCFLDYQIFKKYNEIGLEKSAFLWRPGDPLDEMYEPFDQSNGKLSKLEKRQKHELERLSNTIEELREKALRMMNQSNFRQRNFIDSHLFFLVLSTIEYLEIITRCKLDSNSSTRQFLGLKGVEEKLVEIIPKSEMLLKKLEEQRIASNTEDYYQVLLGLKELLLPIAHERMIYTIARSLLIDFKAKKKLRIRIIGLLDYSRLVGMERVSESEKENKIIQEIMDQSQKLPDALKFYI